MWLSLESTPRRCIGWLLAVVLVVPALARADDPKGKDKPKDDKPATPAEEYQALMKEYQTAEQEFSQKLRELTPDEQGKHFETYPVYTFTPRFLELAQKYPKNAVAVDALVWVVTRARATDLKTVEAWNIAVDTLLSDHIENDKLAPLMGSMVYSYSPKGEKLLRTALKKSPRSEVQGQACLALAQYLRWQVLTAGRLRDDPTKVEQFEGFLGKERTKQFLTADLKTVTQETEELLERVIEEYADLKHWRGTLGQAAEGELFEIRNLAIGKVAPDIESEDIDGESFKLSDYRGKVVVLDFWGNW